ncbi:MAG: lycopene cyclase domain-containing protein [Elusimicrobiota bacterium]|jgi:lycopene cyclase domain-containing protein
MRLPLYFLSTLLYFWLPAAALAWKVYPGLDRLSRRAFWLTLAVFVPLTAAMEFVCLRLDVWTFSEAKDPLLGLRIFGAPVEEFLFWFGAQPFVLFSYLAFRRRFGRAL